MSRKEVTNLCQVDRVRDASVNGILRLHAVGEDLRHASCRRQPRSEFQAGCVFLSRGSVYSPLSKRSRGRLQETQDMIPMIRIYVVQKLLDVTRRKRRLTSTAELAPNQDGVESFRWKGRFAITHLQICLLYTSRCV